MPYDPRYHQRTSNLEDEIAGYDEVVVKQQRTHRPARNLRNAEQAVIAERLARQQAIDEARARQRSTRLPPNAYPTVRQRTTRREDDELYEDEDLSTRPPRSAVRYQPEEIYRQGNTQVNTYTSPPPVNQRHAIPPRQSAQYQQPPARQYQQERYTEGIDEQVPERPRGYRRRVRLPRYLLLAIGAVLALTVWISGAWVNKWWTDTQNDWTYTQTFRTFSIDAAVGHNHDSTSHPSHFIVQNDKRHIIIIELPADDWSKAVIYSAPTLIGDGQEKTPATISFQANPQTGRLDMVLHVENQTYLFTNNGTKFVTPQGQ
jgi:hypothetical protein